MQYEIFDYGKEKAIEKKDASLFIEKVRAVGDQALGLGRTKSSVIPSEISFLKPFVAPYELCLEEPKLVTEIARDGLVNLLGAGVRLGTLDARGKISLQSVAIRTVFGATEDMPVRALSYLLPALHVLESLRRSGKFSHLPQVQYISMSESGKRINNLNPGKVQKQENLLAEIGMRYIQRFYPELINLIVFANDSTFLENTEVVRNRDLLMTGFPAIPNHPYYMTVSEELESKHRAMPTDYALLHPLVHDMRYELEPFSPLVKDQFLREKPDLVINIGGQSEKLFYGARSMFLESANAEGADIPIGRSVQLFTKHRIPPYMSILSEGVRLGDIHVDEALHNSQIVGYFAEELLRNHSENFLLKREYAPLFQDSGELRRFFEDASRLGSTAV